MNIQPKFLGQVLKKQDCPMCKKLHATKDAVKGKDGILYWRIKSTCTDKVNERMANAFNKLTLDRFFGGLKK